jgi:hypothetical protein
VVPIDAATVRVLIPEFVAEGASLRAEWIAALEATLGKSRAEAFDPRVFDMLLLNYGQERREYTVRAYLDANGEVRYAVNCLRVSTEDYGNEEVAKSNGAFGSSFDMRRDVPPRRLHGGELSVLENAVGRLVPEPQFRNLEPGD